jgi:hypothetical protein
MTTQTHEKEKALNMIQYNRLVSDWDRLTDYKFDRVTDHSAMLTLMLARFGPFHPWCYEWQYICAEMGIPLTSSPKLTNSPSTKGINEKNR